MDTISRGENTQGNRDGESKGTAAIVNNLLHAFTFGEGGGRRRSFYYCCFRFLFTWFQYSPHGSARVGWCMIVDTTLEAEFSISDER